MRKASEVLSGSVELQFPDVDISGAAGTAKLLALTVRFDGSVQTVWEDTLDLIVRARRFGEIRHHASAQVDAHDRGLTTRLIAGESHFVIVVVEILRLKSAATVLAFIHDLFVDQRRWSMRQIEFCDDQTRGFGCQIGVLLGSLRVGNFKRLFRNGGSFAHLLTKLSGSRSALLAEKPQFVVAGAAYADVLEMIGTNQDIVAGNQVHHPQKHSGRHIAGQAANFTGV